MNLAKEFPLLVIFGAWNRSIFSGEWIKKFLLPKDTFSFEIALDNAHRITTEKIRIEFHGHRINFIPMANDMETYQDISHLSLKIADYLPHTPVFSYGVNFVFHCKIADVQGDLIKISDVDKLREYDIEVIGSQYKHSVKFNDIPINIMTSTSNDNLYLEFNFHSNIKDFIEFKEKTNEFPVEKLYAISLEIMKNVYEVQL